MEALTFISDENAQLPSTQQERIANNLTSYIQHLETVMESGIYSFPESSINLPSDEALFANVIDLKKKLVSKKLKYVVLIGIGGSNLGTKAIYDALHGSTDVSESERFPKLLCADTCDPEMLQSFIQLLRTIKDPEEILINLISKSGGTIESLVNAEILLHEFKKRVKEFSSRIVITTDAGSKLWDAGKTLGAHLLSIPEMVGGRFSVFSAVGLFPLLALGINVRELREGAQEMREACLTQTDENPAVRGASQLFWHAQKGKMIHDLFLFHPELESLGKWYRQLLAESVGKEKDLSGKSIRSGITPTVSIGSTDLHSVGQLYLGGPRDKYTTFVSIERENQMVRVPQKPLFPTLTAKLEGIHASSVMSAILQGVKAAYAKQRLPFTTLVLGDLSERSIGAFLQFKMIETMYLGHLYRVNTFNQPNVELYKAETKRILHS